jgi:hypothetical protein
MVDGEPHIQHLSWYRGLTLGECRRSGRAVPCRGPQEEVYTEPPIMGTTNQVLRSWGTILALAFFPVFYDTTFEQRLSIFKLDSGDGYTFPDARSDGTPLCAYGPVQISAAHTAGCAREDADYVVFESERFHTPYVATKIFSRITFNLEEEQTGFQLLANMLDKQSRVRELRALPTPTPDQRRELETLSDELEQDESYLEYLIDVQRSFGISSWL